MFNSQILDVAIGLIFVYLLLSLICSAANEIVEMVLKKRAKHLEEGLRELLHHDDLVARVYNHALVNGLFGGTYQAGSRKLPSYIPSANFALALMDLVLPGQAGAAALKSGAADATAPAAAASPPPVVINVAPAPGMAAPPPPPPPPNPLQPLRDAVQNFPYPEVQQALLPLVDAAGKDAAKARQNIEEWYNASMDRVSGWYKRRAQVFILIIGLFVAVFLNADSVAIVKALNSDKSLRELAVAEATQYLKENTSPSPTPAPAASPKPSPSPSPNPTTSPRPTPKPSVSPTTGSASNSPTPSPSPAPACVKDPNSPQCKYEKSLGEIKALGLPIGWGSVDDVRRQWPGWHWKHPGGWWHQLRWHLIGWLITALAISLGAPFWFDMLNKFIVVRSTVKPKEKSQDEPSKS